MMDEIPAEYAWNDGELCSLKLTTDYIASDSSSRQAAVEMLIRKRVAKNKWEPCRVHILLSGIQKVVINDDFELSRYSDVTFTKTESNAWYLSLDPHGNSGEPHEDDNMVFVADSMNIKEGAIQARF